jgi:hypothetical protein
MTWMLAGLRTSGRVARPSTAVRKRRRSIVDATQPPCASIASKWKGPYGQGTVPPPGKTDGPVPGS